MCVFLSLFRGNISESYLIHEQSSSQTTTRSPHIINYLVFRRPPPTVYKTQKYIHKTHTHSDTHKLANKSMDHIAHIRNIS